jgi:Arc/MetJ-type ribon-helix-helix transcriptional regulator
MKNLVAVRLTERQENQLDELVKAGFGNQSDVIRTAIDRMYQQEKGDKMSKLIALKKELEHASNEKMSSQFDDVTEYWQKEIDRIKKEILAIEKGDKMSRNWLGYRTSKKSDKQKAIDEFEEIGIGGLEIDEYDRMTVDDIESMGHELEEALNEYKNSLADPELISSNRIMEIVEKVTRPYLEKYEYSIDPDSWVDYLVQISAIESEQEYADWVLNTPITEVSQTLANQPCDTPTAERLYEWAENFEND